MPVILVIEDNPINRDVLGRRLEKRGYSVRFAEDGPSGIEAAGELRPDLILMDIGLGEAMDGWAATRCIKADPEVRPYPDHCPYGERVRVDRRKSLAAGCCDFDTKPVDLPRLLSKIEHSLRTAALS